MREKSRILPKNKVAYGRKLEKIQKLMKEAVEIDGYQDRIISLTVVSTSSENRGSAPKEIIEKGLNAYSFEQRASKKRKAEAILLDQTINPQDETIIETSPTIATQTELQPEYFWVDPVLQKKADELDPFTVPPLPQINSREDFAELGESEMGKIQRAIIFDNLSNYKKYGAAMFEEHANIALRGLYRKHSMFSGQLQNHNFVMRTSGRQIWWLAPRNRYKLEEAFKMKSKIETVVDSLEGNDPELVELVENIQNDLIAQRETSYRQSSSLKLALTREGIQHDDASTYNKVRRVLIKIGWKCGQLEQVKPCISEATRQERLNFAKWSKEQFSKDNLFHQKLIHSDECSVMLNDTADHNFKAWRKKGELLEPAEFKVKRSQSIMVWAAVSHNYKSELIFFLQETVRNFKGTEKTIYKTINCGATEYKTVVLSPFFEDLKRRGLIKDNKLDGKYFLQDGAPCHTASSSLEFIDSQIGLDRTISKVKAYKKRPDLAEKAAAVWPASSPDLNPLDYSIWNSLKRKAKMILGKQGYFKNLGEAKAILTQAWAEIPQEQINRVCAAFERRCEDVILGDGHFREGTKLNRGAK